MERCFSRDLRVPASRCGADGCLTVNAVFDLFMDLAAEHLQNLGMGLRPLRARGLLWVTVRTSILVSRRPAMLEPIRLTTWPEKPGTMRCCRSYTVTAGEETLVRGKSEFAAIEMGSFRPLPVKGLYPPELEASLTDETAVAEPFSRIGESFAPEEKLGEYVVRPSDIDMAGHMNNTMYPRMLMDFIPVSEQREKPVRELELCYRSPCFEGDVLTLYRRETEDGAELGVFRPDGKTALLVKMK